MALLAKLLNHARGPRSYGALARELKLSYTFVRSVHKGTRHPSDEVLVRIAEHLGLDPGELLIAAYCDRSEALRKELIRRGIQLKGARGPKAPLPRGAPTRAR